MATRGFFVGLLLHSSYASCQDLTSNSLTVGKICPLEVGVTVGKPAYDIVPYGGHKAKNGAKENTWDDSEDEELRISEDDIVPPVSLILFLKGTTIAPQSRPSRCKTASFIENQFRTSTRQRLTLFVEEAQIHLYQHTSERIRWIRLQEGEDVGRPPCSRQEGHGRDGLR